MVNFRDPRVVDEAFVAFVKFNHVVDGLYLWEFLTTLDYEWSVIRGQRPYRWTIWIYSVSRIAALLTVILNLLGLDLNREINCQAWITFVWIFAFIGISGGSLLIVLRVFAIWSRNKAIMVFVTSVWGANVAFLIQGVARIRAAWVPVRGTCAMLNIQSTKSTFIVLFATDTILLLTMLVGLLHMRHSDGSTFYLPRLLWKQGVMWILLATIADLLPMIFISLDLNDVFSVMFLMPCLIAMTIGPTRMYRSLTNVNVVNSQHSGQGMNTFKSKPIRSMLEPKRNVLVMPTSRLEVSVQSATEEYPGSQDSSYLTSVNTEPSKCGTSQRHLCSDLEDVEKQ
ncbi:hypothetical protein F5148DRAFT_1181223 [Russula earlei]|uniref:Uncharacterized protein n=1 Tax=Russula earlei TaxID=71964 RepID=A0ACC0UF16_9AGAM|nr:hypothetical protein F5148DRAFT_1181223 [Russula earlei]